MTFDTVILSCEHGGAVVPPRYRTLFRSQHAQRALGTHRGLDLGALVVARALARRFGWPLQVCYTTRLLVDVNRSVGHRRLFSEFSAGLDRRARARVLALFHTPHRRAVEALVQRAIRDGRRVLHLSVHTFVPRLHNHVRQTDIGLLYDPARSRERAFCARWLASMQEHVWTLRVRRNYPYRGTADGLTTTLRRRYQPSRYAGIELEVSQELVSRSGATRTEVVGALGDSLQMLLGQR